MERWSWPSEVKNPLLPFIISQALWETICNFLPNKALIIWPSIRALQNQAQTRFPVSPITLCHRPYASVIFEFYLFYQWHFLLLLFSTCSYIFSVLFTCSALLPSLSCVYVAKWSLEAPQQLYLPQHSDVITLFTHFTELCYYMFKCFHGQTCMSSFILLPVYLK